MEEIHDEFSDVNILLLYLSSLSYILQHLKDKKLRSGHIHCMSSTSFSLSNCTDEIDMARSSLHSLRIPITSLPCNKYEQITPSFFGQILSLILLKLPLTSLSRANL